MTVLGVDPGTLVTGYGVIESVNGRLRMLECDAIRNAVGKALPDRLKVIFDKLTKVIDQYHPDELALETAFYGKNAQSALKLGHARGVSMLAAVMHRIPTTEYSPREVKKAVVGTGAASKEQVQYMVKSMLRMKTTPRFYDTTDALAVALCHLQRRIRPAAKFRDWKTYVKANPKKVRA